MPKFRNFIKGGKGDSPNTPRQEEAAEFVDEDQLEKWDEETQP